MKPTIRIIGGQYRSKKVSFPEIEGLRPTPDRVKETLFNWLMHDIRDAHCLDAFAGSGSLGFEAFSRGASEVTMLENDPIAFSHLRQIALSFKTPKLKIVHTDTLKFLKTMTIPMDIIFLDPPFASDYMLASVQLITDHACLKKGGLLYIESDKKILLDQAGWTERKSNKAGQVYFALYEKRT